LYAFLTLLNNLYMDGADFVDLHGEIDADGTQDNVTVSVPLNYMSEDNQREASGPPPPNIEEEEDTPLTEEVIKKLINNA